MAELTEQDKKNYEKLKEAFAQLYLPQSDILGEEAVLTKVREKIKIEQSPKDTEELREKIERLERYQEFSDDLEKPLTFKRTSSEKPEKFEQQFLDSLEELKRSLKVIEDEILGLTEGIEKFQPDSLFFKFIAALNPKQWTTELINNLDPLLDEGKVGELTNEWGNAVTTFVEDARKNEGQVDEAIPRQPKTFAHFFRIHKELEVLYSRLADSKTVREF